MKECKDTITSVDSADYSSDSEPEKPHKPLEKRARGSSGVDSDLSDSEVVEVGLDSLFNKRKEWEDDTVHVLPCPIKRVRTEGADTVITEGVYTPTEFDIGDLEPQTVILRIQEVNPLIHDEFIRCLEGLKGDEYAESEVTMAPTDVNVDFSDPITGESIGLVSKFG